MPNRCTIRAGRGGKQIEDFESGYIAKGWNQIGGYRHFLSAQSHLAILKSRDFINTLIDVQHIVLIKQCDIHPFAQ